MRLNENTKPTKPAARRALLLRDRADVPVGVPANDRLVPELLRRPHHAVRSHDRGRGLVPLVVVLAPEVAHRRRRDVDAVARMIPLRRAQQRLGARREHQRDVFRVAHNRVSEKHRALSLRPLVRRPGRHALDDRLENALRAAPRRVLRVTQTQRRQRAQTLLHDRVRRVRVRLRRGVRVRVRVRRSRVRLRLRLRVRRALAEHARDVRQHRDALARRNDALVRVRPRELSKARGGALREPGVRGGGPAEQSQRRRDPAALRDVFADVVVHRGVLERLRERREQGQVGSVGCVGCVGRNARRGDVFERRAQRASRARLGERARVRERARRGLSTVVPVGDRAQGVARRA
eukprot:29579-Pelagococcus_subviridis.AAC.5